MRIRRFAITLSLFAWAAFGQEFRATVSGNITDATGAAVAGVKITATETRTGAKSQTTSEAAGQYTIPFLSPGLYEISAQAQGFKLFLRKDVSVGAGDHPVIDIRLEVGEATQSVEVTADVTLLNLDNGSTGQAITTKEVEDIPLNGGTPLMVSQYAIGVIATGTPTLVHPFDLGAPAAFSIGGAAAQTNELLVNGVPNATWDGRAAYNPPRDAVQEVQVKAFDSDASFGHTGGGTMNQVMKGGTNSLHGSAWEYAQPSNMVANDFFRNRAGQGLQVTHYNQFGVSAGGPVVLPKFNGRNRLFWFFAYEGLKDGQPSPAILTVPTDAEKQGNFSQLLALGSQYQVYDPNSAVLNGTTVVRTPFPGNVIPQNRLSAIALNYMKFYPEPNVTVGVPATGTGNYSSNATTVDNYNNELGRLDWMMSSRSRLFFDVRKSAETQLKNNYFNNPAEGSLLYRNPIGSTVDEVYTINPSTVADVRVNFTRLGEIHALPSSGYSPTTLGFPSYVAGDSPYLQMPGISLSSGTFQNLAGSGASNYPSQSFQVFADVVKIRGNHTIKFGVDLRQYRMNFITDGNSTGSFTFNNSWTRSASNASSTTAQGQDLASFLLGLPSSGSYDLNSYSSFYSYYEAGFIQDDWRARRNLTISVGLHYDHDGPVREKWGRTVDGFAYDSPSPIAAQAQAAYAKNPVPQSVASQLSAPLVPFNAPGGLLFATPGNNAVYRNTSHLASPRFGFAWTPDALHGNTVLRGGFGMFVSPITISSLSIAGTYSTSPNLAQEGFSQTTTMAAAGTGSVSYLTPGASLADPFPQGLVAPAGSTAGLGTFLGQSVNFLNPDAKNPYSLRWNLDVQHTFGANMMLEVAYIGNHSVHLPINTTSLNNTPVQYLSALPVRDNNLNTVMSTNVPNPMAGLLPNGGSLNNANIALATLLLPYPEFSGVTEQGANLGRSYFHSLNVRLQRRLSHGLSVIANYGYSRLMEQDTWLNSTDPVPEKRVSPFDRTQRIATVITYNLPIGRGRGIPLNSRWLDAVAGGWQLNSAYNWQVGGPLIWGNGSTTNFGDYVYFGGPGALAASLDNRQANTDPNNKNAPITAFNAGLFVTNSANTFAYHVRTLSSTFSNLRADGLNEWDPSLLKRFQFSEKSYLQLRFEFFNVLNHPTFAAPNMQATGNSFGLITAVSNRPRTIQLAGRIVF
jgi:hypothetical protein